MSVDTNPEALLVTKFKRSGARVLAPLFQDPAHVTQY